jgi:hypothetical protein
MPPVEFEPTISAGKRPQTYALDCAAIGTGNKVVIIIIIIIIIRDNEKRTCMLIDVAISEDKNVIKKEAEKILRYKDLTIEIQRMWNVKTKVIPVTIGATGTISK